MNKYKIQHKIVTLAHCAVMDRKENPASFVSEGIDFSHWEFNYADGWLTDAWLAEELVESDIFIDAINIFRKKLVRIVLRISLISQSYIEFINESFLVHKVNSDLAFFHYIQENKSVGLMFMESEKEALEILLKTNKIPEEFYFYWNDTVNTTGYSSKLLMMFSALEALARNRDKKMFKDKIDLYNTILGKDLAEEIFTDGTGLRNRLIHGEYLNSKDSGKDYLDLIHKKVISYFNESIIGKKLLAEDVVHPQRHPFGNKSVMRDFIKARNPADFDLKVLLQDYDENGFRNPQKFENYFEEGLRDTY